jgi:hypothetical protein
LKTFKLIFRRWSATFAAREPIFDGSANCKPPRENAFRDNRRTFISDAVAEYKDNQLAATLGNLRAAKFSSEDVELQTLLAQNVKISNAGDTTTVSAPNLRAGVVKTEDATLRGVNAGNVA